jgi:hypothetical protein
MTNEERRQLVEIILFHTLKTTAGNQVVCQLPEAIEQTKQSKLILSEESSIKR